MNEVVKDYPPYLDYPKPRKKQTNADRIRAMTDVELAVFLCSRQMCGDCIHLHDGTCEGAKNGYLEWLKQEVEE